VLQIKYNIMRDSLGLKDLAFVFQLSALSVEYSFFMS